MRGENIAAILSVKMKKNHAAQYGLIQLRGNASKDDDENMLGTKHFINRILYIVVQSHTIMMNIILKLKH